MDDPVWFGRIAAANSLSDVYAMGGRPITALNLVMYPMKKLGPDLLREILRGGHEKISEAGASLAGGHSVDDEEPKYGLAVTGIVSPDRILTNTGVRPERCPHPHQASGNRRPFQCEPGQETAVGGAGSNPARSCGPQSHRPSSGAGL